MESLTVRNTTKLTEKELEFHRKFVNSDRKAVLNGMGSSILNFMEAANMLIEYSQELHLTNNVQFERHIKNARANLSQALIIIDHEEQKRRLNSSEEKYD